MRASLVDAPARGIAMAALFTGDAGRTTAIIKTSCLTAVVSIEIDFVARVRVCPALGASLSRYARNGDALVDDADVHVIWLDLAGIGDDSALATSLSPTEGARVARLATTELRRRAVARFARRREVLAELLDCPAGSVELVSDDVGRLRATGPARSLVVSSSSRGEHCVLAIAQHRRLGVDVEARSEVLDTPRFIRRVATSGESGALATLDPAEQRDALARLWTRKEAYLKATGEGIGGGVAHVEVPIPAGLWAHSFEPVLDGCAWLLYDLVCPVDDLAAALVIEPGPRPPGIVVSKR